jgi:hypothetical protein
MSGKRKQEIISFKVDETLAHALEGIENRSEFIRSAILTALRNTCPLCMGTGMLTPDQYRHWSSFTQSHSIKECGTCHAFHIVCGAKESAHIHPKG